MRPRDDNEPHPVPADQPARVQVEQPSDFIALVPYLLGFHPQSSLVVLFLGGGRIKLTARFDLPPPAEAAAAARYVAQLATRVRAGEALLLGYGTIEPTRRLLRRMMRTLRLPLLDVLVVGQDRWWSLCCPGPCCPADGSPYDLGTHPLALQAIIAGLSAAPSRDGLYQLIAGPPDDDVVELRSLAEAVGSDMAELDLATRRRRMAALVNAHLEVGDLPSDEDCVRFATLATDLTVRDVALAMMTRVSAPQHLELWRRVVARTPAPLESAPLCLLAVAAWLSGNGALLNCCIDRMELIQPDYSMLWICRDISERALAPAEWDAMALDVRRELMAG